MASKPETLTWQPGGYTLEYVLRNLPLPQVVVCDHTACESEEIGCGPPLLLHSVRDLPRAVGVSLVQDRGKALKETGERLIVPFDYRGWFILSRSKPKCEVVPVYNDVASLITAGCSRFLIGGTEKVPVLRRMATAYAYAPAVASPGDSFRAIALLQHEKKYLHCLNETNHTVLLDFESKGTFYMISNKNKKVKLPLVLQMRDIVSSYHKKLPCDVKLLIGKRPVQECSFAGWIRLTGIERVPSLLACTVSLGENGLIEIPKNGSLKYRIATLNDAWKEYMGYREAKRLCRTFAEEYARSMKKVNVNSTPASVLRRALQSDSVGQTLLNMTVRKGRAPPMTKLLHNKTRTINTISESRSEDSENAETDSGYENSHPSRSYEDAEVVSSPEIAVYTTMHQAMGSGPHVYLTVNMDSESNPEMGRSRDYLTVLHAREEEKSSSVKVSDNRSSGVPGGHAESSFHVNQENTDEVKCQNVDISLPDVSEPFKIISHRSEKKDGKDESGALSYPGRKNVTELVELFEMKFTLLKTLDDAHDYINVVEMVVGEKRNTSSVSLEGSDYVNIPDSVGIKCAGVRQADRVSAADSGVFSINEADDWDDGADD